MKKNYNKMLGKKARIILLIVKCPENHQAQICYIPVVKARWRIRVVSCFFKSYFVSRRRRKRGRGGEVREGGKN